MLLLAKFQQDNKSIDWFKCRLKIEIWSTPQISIFSFFLKRFDLIVFFTPWTELNNYNDLLLRILRTPSIPTPLRWNI